MARVRKLILTIASGSVLYSGLAPAIGLGEITINSGLNQPLEAEIELLEVGDLSESEMRIALAPPDAFMHAGVDRTAFLDDLRFTTLLRGNKSIIRVVSRKPVREPYLNFVVEMARPNGRVLREYTLLIDPPGVLADRPQTAGFQRSTEPAAPRMQLPTPSAPPAAVQGNSYRVARGDSLWKIARRLQRAGSQIALPDLMADIHALNPQAFVGGDIDRLISGANLLLPDRANPLGSAAAPLAETPGSVAASPQQPGPVPVPVTEEVAAVQQRLDEVLLAQDLQRQQLQQQMNELQSQLSTLRVEVANKDQQVAALQEQLQQRSEATVVSASSAEAAPVINQSVATQSQGFSSWLFSLIGGGLLAAIVGGLLWWQRRDPAETEPERVLADYPRVQPVPVVAATRSQMHMHEEVLEEPEEMLSAGIKHKPAEKKSAVVAEPDALDGANIYVAYGRLDEAREVLERALEKEPGRNDVRLRLLELLARMGDSVEFEQHEQQLIAYAGDLAQLGRIKIAHPDFSEQQAQRDPLAEAVLDLGDSETPGDTLESAPFNLDDLTLDSDWGLSSPFDQAVAPAKADPAQLDVQISGNLELPEVMDIPADASAEVFSPFANFHIKSRPAEELLSSSSLDSTAELPRSTPSNLDHLAGNPQSISRLNMALAYIDQGNLQSACDILNQLISEGDDKQKKQAREILARIA